MKHEPYNAKCTQYPANGGAKITGDPGQGVRLQGTMGSSQEQSPGPYH